MLARSIALGLLLLSLQLLQLMTCAVVAARSLRRERGHLLSARLINDGLLRDGRLSLVSELQLLRALLIRYSLDP